MTSKIHQLYCTHCTYGTAAQHRHSGNVRNQPFEYSTRAGSVDLSAAHQTFQRFEKQFFRGIPMAGDADIELRRSTVVEAPWRKLMYSPSVDGLMVLANVCYRPKDTAGRLGSYFAHILLEEHNGGAHAWSPADCLKLWGASFWQTSDTEISGLPQDEIESSFVLETLGSLDQPGFGTAVNDAALRRFLNSPAQDVPTADVSRIESAQNVFPARWQKKTPEERTRLLVTLLRAVMELDLERHERLTLAVEPGVAALLFYGIARLLPSGNLVQQLSFSTFESHLDKSSTVLTAHDFADPMATDLLPETYRARGFAINTFRPAAKLAFRHTDSQFAEMIVRTFIDAGPTAADRILTQMAAVGQLTYEVCESLTAIRNRVKNALSAELPSPNEFSRLTNVEKRFAGFVWVDLLANASDEIFRSVSRKPIYLHVLESVSSITNDPLAKQVALNLVKVLPARDDVRNGFFGSAFVSPSLKTAWLKSFLNKSGQFPKNCPSLFETSSKTNGVLTELLLHATAQQVSTWCKLVPAKFAWQFTAALASAVNHDPHKRSLLIAAIEGLDDQGLSQLFDKASGRADLVLEHIQSDDVRFVQRMTRLSDSLRSSPHEQIVGRVDALLAVASQLPSRKGLLDRWSHARDSIRRCGHCIPVREGQSAVEMEGALSQALNSIGFAISDRDHQPAPLEIESKNVEAMLVRWLRPDQSELCRQLIALLPKLQLSMTEDVDLCAFLAHPKGTEWLKSYPRSDPTLAERLRRILEGLPENLSSFPVRIAGLTAAKSILGGELPKWDVWRRLNEMLTWIKKLRDRVNRVDAMVGDDVAIAAMGLAPLVYLTLNGRISIDSSQKGPKKLIGMTDLEKLSIAMIGDKTLVESNLMLKFIEAEFEKQASKGSKKLGLFSK